MNSQPISVVIAGGGTAGHIEPALAVGEVLKLEFGAAVTALGTEKGLERDIVPARGFPLRLITPVPIPRKVNGALFRLPGRLFKSIAQTRSILKEVGADAVFGTGGYVAAPAYLAAKSLGLPFFVLETNALAGMANKLGVRLGGVGLNATAGSGMPGQVVGVPVRPTVGQISQDAKAAARSRWKLESSKPIILVTGGSQGAQSINRALAESIDELTQKYQVLHAYGKKNDVPVGALNGLEGYTALPYIDDMAGALGIADMVICRSGAMTVAEVSAAGLPAIYIPLPIGNGEQALNSQSLVRAGAALHIKDSDLNGRTLVEAVEKVLGDSKNYTKMRAAVSKNSAGDAARVIAQRIVSAINAQTDGADPKHS